jgi:hypothetical protein
MGTILDSKLRRAKVTYRPGELRPVGATSARCECSATVIRKRENGWWYDEEELPIEVWPIQYQEVELADGNTLLWSGMAAKLRADKHGREWKGKHLITALVEPESQNWYACAPFRPPKHRSKAVIDAALNKAAKKGGSLPATIHSLRFDPFETDGKWLTARFVDPMRFRWPEVETIDDGYAVAHARISLKTMKPLWSFGVCVDLDAARRDLRIEAFLTNRLDELPGRPGGAHGEAQKALDEILDTAIWQALAGRTEGSKASRVVDRVIHYVHNKLENLSKHFDGKPRGLKVVSYNDKVSAVTPSPRRAKTSPTPRAAWD